MADLPFDLQIAIISNGISKIDRYGKIYFYLSDMENSIGQLQYPIGRFKLPPQVSSDEILQAISTIASFPKKMEDVFNALSPITLEQPYRPGGWTARQVIHHCADSHMNALIRFKLGLTEQKPTIKPYDQAQWANLSDNNLDPAISISILKGVHQRWVAVMEAMNESDWKRSFFHPEYQTEQRLEQAAMLYAWHCEHHLGHVRSVL